MRKYISYPHLRRYMEETDLSAEEIAALSGVKLDRVERMFSGEEPFSPAVKNEILFLSRINNYSGPGLFSMIESRAVVAEFKVKNTDSVPARVSSNFSQNSGAK